MSDEKKNNKEVRVLHFYILRSSLTEEPKHYSQSRLFEVIDTCSSAKFLTCESLHILQQTPTNQRNRVSIRAGWTRLRCRHERRNFSPPQIIPPYSTPPRPPTVSRRSVKQKIATGNTRLSLQYTVCRCSIRG